MFSAYICLCLIMLLIHSYVWPNSAVLINVAVCAKHIEEQKVSGQSNFVKFCDLHLDWLINSFMHR